MAVTAQQALGVSRQPLRVGRVRYGMWWLEQATAGARARVRAVGVDAAAVGRSFGHGTAAVGRSFGHGTVTVGRELRWAAELSVRAVAAGIDHVRPEPWSDRKLLALVAVIAVGALGVAIVLGMGTAQWMMTSADAMNFAAAGALAVGLTFLPLAYLVFASKRRARRE